MNLFISVKFLTAEDEIAAKVFFPYNGVLGKFFARPPEKDASFEEQIGPVGDTERLRGVVVSDEDSDVLLLELIDYTLDVFHRDGVNAGEGLVEHYEFWIDGEASCYLRASAFAAGELIAEIFPHLLQTEF